MNFMLNKNLKISLLLSSILLTGCISAPSLDPKQRPAHWGQQLSPADNFYQISETVFRSEQPDASLLPLLNQHGIDRVINLRSRDSDKAVFQSQKQTLRHIPIHTWALDREDLLLVMQDIQRAKQQQQQVLLHCYHGSDRTGTSVAMYRIVFQNWSKEDALNEMKHGGYGFHPIWRNIENVFSNENIHWVRAELAKNKNTATALTLAVP